jgi:hypothetical protein
MTRPAAKPTDHETPAERRDRIAEIRRQIAAGTYETTDKLAVAVERLCEDMSPPASYAKAEVGRRKAEKKKPR